MSIAVLKQLFVREDKMELNKISMEPIVRSAKEAPEILQPPGNEEARAMLTFQKALELANKTVRDITEAESKGVNINIYA